MWPQKWNASAVPGLTSAEIAPPPARTARNREVRARKPRRDVDAARLSPIGRTSGKYGLRDRSLRCGDDSLELAVAVERAFGANLSFAVDRDRVRAPGNTQAPPEIRVANLVENSNAQMRARAEGVDDGHQRLTEPARLRREDGEGQLRVSILRDVDT